MLERGIGYVVAKQDKSRNGELPQKPFEGKWQMRLVIAAVAMGLLSLVVALFH